VEVSLFSDTKTYSIKISMRNLFGFCRTLGWSVISEAVL
jgi:hypothetical protein